MLYRRLSKNVKYVWDTEGISVPVEFVDKVKINGKSLADFLSTIGGRVENIKDGEVKLRFRDFYGTLKIVSPNDVCNYIIIPKKISTKDSPKDVYEFIRGTILSDLKELADFIIKDIRKIQTNQAFKIVFGSEWFRSRKLLATALDRHLWTLIEICNLLFTEPVNKKIVKLTSEFGTTVKLQSNSPWNPKQEFYRVMTTFDTLLNKMLFQAFYLIALGTQMLLIDETKEIKENAKKIEEKAWMAIDSFRLWDFYDDRPLNMVELYNEVVAQQNPYYLMVLEIYASVIRLLFSKTVFEAVEEGIEYPLLNFSYLYEAWAIKRIIDELETEGFTLIGRGILTKRKFDKGKVRSAKAIFEFLKGNERITLFWELKFRPVEDTIYFGDLARIAQKTNEVEKMRIKPDIVIVYEVGNTIKKLIIGDVKFRVAKKVGLPRIGDVYKVVGYYYDLKKFKLFKLASTEGILIYPGNLEGSLRIPIENLSETFYINIVPLNDKNLLIDVYDLLRSK